MFDYDDPGLASALGEPAHNLERLKRLEADTCTVCLNTYLHIHSNLSFVQVLKKEAWPAINSCVYADIKELRNSSERFDACFAHAVASVECWVRCASIIVQNDSRERVSYPLYYS
jgi:hypothetical protein